MAKRISNGTLGQRIRNGRLDCVWTQDELCAKVGLSKGFLSDLENDKRRPSADTLLAIARALGHSMEYLMCGRRK